jgi:NADH-quinone oxidoreductase subunit M
MTELHFPFLEVAILLPLIGALLTGRMRDPYLARKYCVVFTALTFLCATAAFLDFELLHAKKAEDKWHLMSYVVGHEVFVIDQLSAPLLPLTSLLFFLTTVTTLKTKIRRFSFSWTMFSEATLLATFSCSSGESWLLIFLLAVGTVPPFLELRARKKPTRVYAVHMALFVALMFIGRFIVDQEGEIANQIHSYWAIAPLMAAVLIRCGMVPVHCWTTDLFENATFGTALLYTTPSVGAYLAIRLLLPIAPDEVLRSLGMVSLITAVYAAGMALIQRDARRFFCYVFLSHSALILVGLEVATTIGVTGALCVWLSVGLSLGGFGLTLRALEARVGDLRLTEFRGLYEHTPSLAVCFFLTGLASVGFPGTFGFIGTELLVDGAVEVYPYIGVAVVIAAALNGIAFVKTYFVLFTGKRYSSTVSLAIGLRERFAVLALAGLILLGGLAPQYNVHSRYLAAEELLNQRPDVLEAEVPTAHADDEHHPVNAAGTAASDHRVPPGGG